MALPLFNDGLDDTPATAESGGWLGADFAAAPVLIGPAFVQAGRNLVCDESGLLATRPGLAWVTLCHEADLSDGGSPAPQGAAYYDNTAIERILVARDGVLHAVSTADSSAAVEVLAGVTPALSTSARVSFAQLVDRMFFVDRSLNLRWALYDGAWSYGSVAAFANTNAMPAWGGLHAHGLRLFAFPVDGSRLYTSAVGEAHAAANWTQTDNLRFGIGEGDPIVGLASGQSGNLIVLTEGGAFAVDTSDAVVANWTVTAITRIAGCAAPRSILAVGQDVIYLSRYGLVSLGALIDTTGINPATTISAAMQPIIDRINWAQADRIHATTWRDYYLLALPLGTDEWPTVWLCYNLRTRAWCTPWEANLPGVILGDNSQTVLINELGEFFVDETPAALLTDGSASPSPLVTLTAEGWAEGVVTRFAGRRETVVIDSVGRLMRFDPVAEDDAASPTYAHDITSWATTKAFAFDHPEHPKQPFWLEMVFDGSTAEDVRLAYLPDAAIAYPDAEDADLQLIESGMATGSTGGFPIVFPMAFRQSRQSRRRWHLRHLPRFRDAALQIIAARGRLRLRGFKFAAFIDSPSLTE